MAKLIAQTYGQALYELASERDRMPQFFEEAQALRAAFTEGDEFRMFMKNPRITQEEKRQVLESSLKGRISDDMVGFLVVLNHKERFGHVVEILDWFIERVREKEGIGRASVSSALELSDAQKQSVREKLLATTSFREIDIDFETDPSLIGGIVIRVGDRVVDGSLRHRLGDLKRSLAQIRV